MSSPARLAAVLLGVLSPALNATQWHSDSGRAQLDLEVYDRTAGRVLPVHWHEGERWVAGTPGHEFELRLRNRTGGRLLAVTSVDGVNVVTGRTAAPDQAGYVLAPWQSASIDGWRKSLDQAAAFYFTRLRNSYAARTGRPDHVGVIGVAVFRERGHPAWYGHDHESRREHDERGEPASSREAQSGAGAASAGDARGDGAARAQNAPAAPSASAEASASAKSGALADSTAQSRVAERSRLGTGHGRRVESRVDRVDFQRATNEPELIVRFYYDSEPNLVARGVIPRPWREARRAPEPFPGGFVPDP